MCVCPSLLAFLLFLLVGSLNLVNLPLDEPHLLWLDAFLCLAFFIQHSVMIRRSLREQLAPFVSSQYDVALFALAVSLQSNRDNGDDFVRDSFQHLIAATPLFQGSLVFSSQALLA